MKKIMKFVGGAAVAAGLLFVSTKSQAQNLTLRVEPGVAVPVTDPQASRFGAGGSFTVKPELAVTPYLGFGPSVSFLALPSRIDGISSGTAWNFGAFGRLKRPHDESNTGTGLSAISPWVDADLGFVYTNPLTRFGWSLGVGAALPTSKERNLWIGPFVRYQGVFQGEKVGYDTSDAKVLIFGLSFEMGGSAPKKVEPAKPCPACPPVPPVVDKPCPPPPPVVEQDVEMELKQVIQFAWDSPKLDAKADAQMTEVVKKITSAKSFGLIKIEGHASSEGQVEHNNVLAKKRAQTVADWLIAHGVPKDKITVTGFGSSVPVATNKTEPGRVLNRRAEFVVKFVVVKVGK